MKILKAIAVGITIVALNSCTCYEKPLYPASVSLHKSAHQDLIYKYIPQDSSLTEEQKKIRIDALMSYGALLEKITELKGK